MKKHTTVIAMALGIGCFMLLLVPRSGDAQPSTRPTSMPAAASRKPHSPPKAGEVRELTIKELGNFDYDQEAGGTIPEDVSRLDGVTVRLHGFMMPFEQAERITRFALVPSLFGCCFGQPPGVQHTIVVECKPVAYSPEPLIVEGTLRVRVTKEDQYVISLFQLAATRIGVAP